METFSFPRYNAPEIVAHIHNKLLTGTNGKKFSKNDLHPNPKPEVSYTDLYKSLTNSIWDPAGALVHDA
ncbi:kinetochore protein Nuf2, partial [Sigmodon hispidus]